MIKDFELHELVHPDHIDLCGDLAWNLLDPQALEVLQLLRDKYGSIIVNDWYWGGNFKFSGLRPVNSTIGAKRSLHKQGMAFDCKFQDNKVVDVYHDIIKNQHLFDGLKRIEHIDHTPTWLHFDTLETNKNEIVIFRP
jgi:hypothetical protein